MDSKGKTGIELVLALMKNNIEGIIYGSGLLAIHKIRKAYDADVLVKNLNDYTRFGPITKSSFGENTIVFKYNGFKIELFDTDGFGKIYDDVEKVRLMDFYDLFIPDHEEWIKWKRKLGRKKDLKDIKLLKDYINQIPFSVMDLIKDNHEI